MTRWGADPNQLRNLASELDLSARQLQRSTAGITSRLRATNWHGPDADRFERTWNKVYRRTLDDQASDLTRLARAARRNADEQEQASTGLDARITTETVRNSRDYYVDVSGSYLGGTGAYAQKITIEDLSPNRRRITTERLVEAGAGISAGSGVRGFLGDHETGRGSSAAADAVATITARTTYDVDADDTNRLIAYLGATSAAAGAPLLGTAVGFLSDRFGPDPISTEALAGFSLSAGAWGSLSALVSEGRLSDGKPSPTVGASASITGGVGIRTEDGEESYVLELSGSGLLSMSGAIDAADAATGGRATQSLGSLLGDTGGDLGGDVSVRIEAPTDESHRPILITTTRSNGDEQVIDQFAIDPLQAHIAALSLASALQRASEHAGDGRVGAAVAQVLGVDVPAESHLHRQTVRTIDEHAAGLEGSAPVAGGAASTGYTDYTVTD